MNGLDELKTDYDRADCNNCCGGRAGQGREHHAGENPGNAEAGAALLEDERKFIDLANSPLWFNEEHVIVG